MTDEIRIVPQGLVTDPSRIVAGDGGLIVANNVVCRSAGLVEPRLPLYQAQTTSEDIDPSDIERGLYANEWNNVIHSAIGGVEETIVLRGSDANEILYRNQASNGYDFLCRAESMSSRQMWMFRESLRMMDSPDQAPAGDPLGQGAFDRLPGVGRCSLLWYDLSAPGIGVAINAGETAAYQFVLVRWITDARGNRVPLYGPPSDRYVIVNAAVGGAVYVDFQIAVTGLVREGDELRIYRTPANGVSGADPGSDLIYLGSTTVWNGTSLPSGDIQFAEYRDNAKIGEWTGPALYTNDSQEGPLRANYRLRYANDLAAFQGKMFYSGGSAGWRKSVTIKRIGDIDDTDKSRTLISYRQTAGTSTWTSGSNALTVLGAGALYFYVVPGQVVTEVGQRPDDPNPVGFRGVVQSILGSTITLESPASVSGSGNIIVWDWIAAVDDAGNETKIYVPYVSATTIVPGSLNPPFPYGIGAIMTTMEVATSDYQLMSGGVEAASSYWMAGAFPNYYRPMLRIYSSTGAVFNENITITAEWDASFGDVLSPGDLDTVGIRTARRITFTSSKPQAFSEPLGTVYSGSQPANRDGDIATIWWSKNNLPEAVPLLNYATLGDEGEPIVRIFSTTDRLWVLKTDGLWMGTGAGDLPDSMTWQQLDATFRMVPNGDPAFDALQGGGFAWAARIRDTVFAWTQHGIVSITTGGVIRIDDAIAKLVRSYTPGINRSNTSNPNPWEHGAFCAASVRDGVVVFGMLSSQVPTLDGPTPSEDDPIPSLAMLVYSPDAGTWATWSSEYLRWPSGGGDSETGMLLMGSPLGYTMATEDPAFDSVLSTDPDRRPIRYDRMPGAIAPYTGVSISSVDGRVLTLAGGMGDLPPPVGSVISDSVAFSLLVLSIDESGPSITVDRIGASTGQITDIWFPYVSTMTFSANQAPVRERHFLDSYSTFQRIRGGTQYAMKWRARQIAEPTDEEPIVYDDPAAEGGLRTLAHDLEHDQAVSTPTSMSRADGLETTIIFDQAGTYFALDSVAIRYQAETEITTPSRRRR